MDTDQTFPKNAGSVSLQSYGGGKHAAAPGIPSPVRKSAGGHQAALALGRAVSLSVLRSEVARSAH